MPLEHVHFLTRILYYAPNSESADQRWAEHELDGLLVSVLSHDPGRCIVRFHSSSLLLILFLLSLMCPHFEQPGCAFIGFLA